MGLNVSRPKASPHNGTPTKPRFQTQGCFGVSGRLRQWLWPAWWGPQSKQLQAGLCQPYLSQPGDCKACRDWGVHCDRSRPQCGHCYDEQILCFYVGQPIIKPKSPRSGRSGANPVPAIREPRPRRA
ncbi:hypothetical protein N7470_005766 [Penicillium chermesinum]|nr:hypothetical protein N7470_005766 [Penicillium chermesinum]